MDGHIVDVDHAVAVGITWQDGRRVALAEPALVGIGDIEVGDGVAQRAADECHNIQVVGIPGVGDINGELIPVGITRLVKGNTLDRNERAAQDVVVNVIVASVDLWGYEAVLGDIDGEPAVVAHVVLIVRHELAVDGDDGLTGVGVIGAVHVDRGPGGCYGNAGHHS